MNRSRARTMELLLSQPVGADRVEAAPCGLHARSDRRLPLDSSPTARPAPADRSDGSMRRARAGRLRGVGVVVSGPAHRSVSPGWSTPLWCCGRPSRRARASHYPGRCGPATATSALCSSPTCSARCAWRACAVSTLPFLRRPAPHGAHESHAAAPPSLAAPSYDARRMAQLESKYPLAGSCSPGIREPSLTAIAAGGTCICTNLHAHT
jgi:hypothetical protein